MHLLLVICTFCGNNSLVKCWLFAVQLCKSECIIYACSSSYFLKRVNTCRNCGVGVFKNLNYVNIQSLSAARGLGHPRPLLLLLEISGYNLSVLRERVCSLITDPISRACTHQFYITHKSLKLISIFEVGSGWIQRSPLNFVLVDLQQGYQN